MGLGGSGAGTLERRLGFPGVLDGSHGGNFGLRGDGKRFFVLNNGYNQLLKVALAARRGILSLDLRPDNLKWCGYRSDLNGLVGVGNGVDATRKRGDVAYPCIGRNILGEGLGAGIAVGCSRSRLMISTLGELLFLPDSPAEVF